MYKMKEILTCLLISTVLMSCTGQTLDLSIVDFDKPADSYPLQNLKVDKKEEQKGHYEIQYNKDGVSLALKDNGERVINYIFMNELTTKQLNYAGILLNSNAGVSISVNDNKIVYINFIVDYKSKFKLYDQLKNKLGEATIIANNSIPLTNIDLEMQNLFFSKLPNEIKTDKENGYFSYPERIFWIKNNVFYKLELNPSGNSIESSLTIISKKAFKDKIIIGYHNPEKDPFLSKYLD